MSQNLVAQLPVEMGGMMHLQQLDVNHNPLIVPPTPEVNKGLEAMLLWLRTNEKLLKSKKFQGLGIAAVNEEGKK
jgi:hypothetical protein